MHSKCLVQLLYKKLGLLDGGTQEFCKIQTYMLLKFIKKVQLIYQTESNLFIKDQNKLKNDSKRLISNHFKVQGILIRHQNIIKKQKSSSIFNCIQKEIQFKIYNNLRYKLQMTRIQTYNPFNLKPIFQLQCAADIEIEKIQPISVIFYDCTKVGNNNLFQYLRGTPMIGKKINGKVVYEMISKEQELGYKFARQTVIPAVARINFGDGLKMTMIEIGGFRQNLNYVGMLTKSCMLLKVFEKLNKVKFIITIDENPLQIQNTFASFIRMMQYKDLSPKLKKQVLRSSYLCLTETKVFNQQQKKLYYEIIQGVVNRVNKKKKQIDHSQQIIEFLENFLRFKKIIFFNQPQQNVPAAEPFQFNRKIMRQDSQRFGFIDIDQSRLFRKGDAIRVPFKQFFEQLSHADYQKMKEDAEWKLQSFRDISTIIQLFIYNLSLDDHIHNNNVSYQHLFHLLKLFLRKYGIYRVILKPENQPERWLVSMSQQIKAVGFDFQLKKGQIKKRPTGLQLMGLLQILYKNSVQLNIKEYVFACLHVSLNAFKQIFASCYEEEQILIDLAYCVGVRSVKELASLQQMKQEIFNFRVELFNMMQNFSGIPFSCFKRNYIFSIFGKHRSFLTKILENQSQYESLAQFVQGFQPEDDDDRIHFEKIKIQLHQLKGDSSMQKQKYVQAIQHYCRANRNLQEYKYSLQNMYAENGKQVKYQQEPPHLDFDEIMHQDHSEFDQNQNQNQPSEISKKFKTLSDFNFTQNQSINFGFLYDFLKDFNFQKMEQNQEQLVLPKKYDMDMRQRIIYRKIGQALRRINTIDSLQLAKRVYQSIQDVENVVIVLEIIEQRQQKLIPKIEAMYYHAKYAQSHGRKEQSIKVYQKILSINEDSRIHHEICRRMQQNQMGQMSYDYFQGLGNYSQVENNQKLIYQVEYYISTR